MRLPLGTAHEHPLCARGQRRWAIVVPIIFLEFLVLSMSRTIIPELIDDQYGESSYVVYGSADGARGLLAFLATPAVGALSDELVAKATAAAQEGSVRFVEERAGSTFKEHNVRVARAALEEVEARGGPAASALLDQAVISSASLPARAERFAIGGRAVVLEGAHVASSVTGLLDELAREEPFGSPCAVVLALGREKDARAVLKALRGHADRVHCTTSHGGPLATGEELAQLGRELGIDARDAGSAREALQAALSGDSSWVLVLGSFYLAGELRPLLLELDQDKCSPSSQTSCSPTPS